jgi:hypothetical protein
MTIVLKLHLGTIFQLFFLANVAKAHNFSVYFWSKENHIIRHFNLILFEVFCSIHLAFRTVLKTSS